MARKYLLPASWVALQAILITTIIMLLPKPGHGSPTHPSHIAWGLGLFLGVMTVYAAVIACQAILKRQMHTVHKVFLIPLVIFFILLVGWNINPLYPLYPL